MKIITPQEAASLVADGATVSVTGCTYRMAPEEILAALEERFLATGHPNGLTFFFPLMVEKTRAGAGNPGTGLDRIAYQNMVRRLIGGSYSRNGGSRLNQLVYGDAVEAYNIPMGTAFQLLRCAASGQPGLLTATGIGTYVDPRDQGGRMNKATHDDLAEVVEFKGREMLYYPTIPIDVALIRGTTVDEMGNVSLEEEAFSLGALYHAMAARNSGGKVVVQAQRLAKYGSLPAKSVKIPAFLVDAVVLDDPSKHDYLDENAPILSGLLRQPVVLPEAKLDPRTVISRRALQEMRPGQVVNLGAGIGMYDVPIAAAAAGLDRDLFFTIEQGALRGVPAPGGVARNPDAFFDSLEVFDFYDGGGIDVACLSFAEVDAKGNVNVSRFADSMPGCGGFINITRGAKKILYCGTLTTKGLQVEIGDGQLRIKSEGQIHRFVAQVGQKTFNAERLDWQRQEVLYLTERCVFRLTPQGPVLTEIAPGVDLDQDIRAQVDFELRVAENLTEMPAALYLPPER